MPYEIIISKEDSGFKPKNFLKKKIDLPYPQLIKYLDAKRITLNKKKIKKDSILSEGDVIKVWLDTITLREQEKKHIEMKNLHLNILCETQDFIVFNKSPDIVVQGAQGHDTSLSLHLAWYKKSIDDTSNFEYVHVHRLDKETSGVLLVGKNIQALRELNRKFKEREIIKKYLCLVVGSLCKEKGEVEIYLKRTPEGVKEKVMIASSKDKDAKRTLSSYKVIKKIEKEGETFSLVEVELKTGFTHQIRVHMKYLKTPILGDSMYGNSLVNKEFESILKRQFLHASSLEFKYEDKNYIIKAPLFPDLEKTLAFVQK